MRDFALQLRKTLCGVCRANAHDRTMSLRPRATSTASGWRRLKDQTEALRGRLLNRW